MDKNKALSQIIPVSFIITSVFSLVLSIGGLILVCIGLSANSIMLIGVPCVIISFVLCLTIGGFSIIFKKSLLCRISAVISALGLILSIIGLIIWLA